MDDQKRAHKRAAGKQENTQECAYMHDSVYFALYVLYYIYIYMCIPGTKYIYIFTPPPSRPFICMSLLPPLSVHAHLSTPHSVNPVSVLFLMLTHRSIVRGYSENLAPLSAVGQTGWYLYLSSFSDAHIE